MPQYHSTLFKGLSAFCLASALGTSQVIAIPDSEVDTSLDILGAEGAPCEIALKNPLLETVEHPPAESSYPALMSHTLRFATPYVLSKVALTAGGIWSGHVYGVLAEEALAAELLTLTWEFLLMGTAMGGMRAVSILVGQLQERERGDDPIATGNVSKASTVATAAYAMAILPVFWNTGRILEGMGIVKDPGILSEVQKYFDGFVWGAPATLFLYGDEQFALGLGDTKLPLIYGSAYATIAGILAYPFATGSGSLPAMGTYGVGLAWATGAIAGWLGIRLHMGLSARYAPYNLMNFRTLRLSDLRKYVTFATPLALSNMLTLAQSWVTSQFIAGKSRNFAEAYNATADYFQQLQVFLLSYSASTGALMAIKDSRKQDAESFTSANAARHNTRLGNASLMTSALIGTSLVIPALIWQSPFINFFGGKLPEAAAEYAESYLWIQAGNFVVTALATALQGSLYGLGDVNIPLAISVLNNSLILLTAGISSHTQATTVLAAATIIGNSAALLGYTGRWCSLEKGIQDAPQADTLPTTQEDEAAPYTWKSAWGLFGLLPWLGW